MRRKKKVVKKKAGGDDKRLQATLKRYVITGIVDQNCLVSFVVVDQP